MPSEPPDILALDDRIRASQRRHEELLTALNLLSKHHVTERFPGLSEFLLEQAENAGREHLSIIGALVRNRTDAGQSLNTISQELAAQMLGVSVKTLSRIEHSPKRMYEIGYPGRNVALTTFRDWATPHRTSRMLNKAARERTKAGHA